MKTRNGVASVTKKFSFSHFFLQGSEKMIPIALLRYDWVNFTRCDNTEYSNADAERGYTK